MLAPNLNMDLVAGLGVHNLGKYAAYENGISTKAYQIWGSMLRRCSPIANIQNRFIKYVGCEVHPEFIRFQDFAEWCHNQTGFDKSGWHLDKDILVPGNKVYGPDTCCFVPNQLNSVTVHRNRSDGGNLPIGVSNFRGRFKAELRIDGRKSHIGIFDTTSDASHAYVTAKLNEVHRLANLWKPYISSKVYDALMRYEVL